MAGYKYRAKCAHRGAIWNPPRNEVATVACSYCKAKPGNPCTERGRRVEPHSVRYIAHHDANCEGRDWSVDSLPEWS